MKLISQLSRDVISESRPAVAVIDESVSRPPVSKRELYRIVATELAVDLMDQRSRCRPSYVGSLDPRRKFKKHLKR
jgi:hypothetical protein